MSSRIPDTHAEAWALLPWLANGRIQASDREWVEAHVQGCAECRAELAAQRMVATADESRRCHAPATAATEEQRSFNKLWARIEASESAATPASGASGAVRPRRARRARCAGWRPRWSCRPSASAMLGFDALRDTAPRRRWLRHGADARAAPAMRPR